MDDIHESSDAVQVLLDVVVLLAGVMRELAAG